MSLNRLFALPWLLILVLPCSLQATENADDKAKEYVDADGIKTLIEPFTPPTLAELNKEKTWLPKPVDDADARYKKFVAAQPPGLPLDKARLLRNTSTAINEEILRSFGILPTDKLRQDDAATMIRWNKADVKSTNPLMMSATEEFDLAQLIGFGLFTFDWTFDAFADAQFVISWEASSDGLCDRVVLRDDMTWSDGRPVTAHDVAYTFRIIMCPDVPIPAIRSGPSEIRWIEAYDDQTIVYFHKKALATNQINMEFPILPKHIYEKTWPRDHSLVKSAAHQALEAKPVVAGPYTLDQRIIRQEMVFNRRPGFADYKGKRVRPLPPLAQVRMKIIEDPNTALLALKTGKIEDLVLNTSQWKNQTVSEDYYDLNTKVRAAEWTYFYFGWNNQHEFFQDKRVREAMAYAYPHEVLLKGLNNDLNEPCLGVFHPTAPMFPKVPLTRYKQDLDKAAELLKAAGWEDTDGDNVLDKVFDVKDPETGKLTQVRKKFDFMMLCSTDPSRIATCNLLKNSLEKLGVICVVRPLESTVLVTRMGSHEFDSYFGGWGSGTDPDTSDNLWITSAINDGRNYVGYSNEQVNGLFLLGKQLPTSEKERQKIYDDHDLKKTGIAVDATRHEIYAKIHELIYRDQPVTFLYYRSAFYGFSNKLLGYHFSPRGPYHYSPGFSSIWKALP